VRSVAQQRHGAAAPLAHGPREDAVLQQRGRVGGLHQVDDARREAAEALQEPGHTSRYKQTCMYMDLFTSRVCLSAALANAAAGMCLLVPGPAVHAAPR
jgi:hypothetical protein